ncbi:hypothetical protein [Beduini massiliensis]|uniref:hypothetical protein n=1 Tax=Beduini massiliensis TaxID=1585974 RepID=UPI0012E09D4A|nr:hypothetical protein [Beduini massiliensis]
MLFKDSETRASGFAVQNRALAHHLLGAAYLADSDYDAITINDKIKEKCYVQRNAP